MKNSNKIIDWLNAKNGQSKPCNGGVSVFWHNKKYQTLFNNNQLKEKLENGKPRYEIVTEAAAEARRRHRRIQREVQSLRAAE